MASARRRSNYIESMKQPDGGIVTKQEEILKVVHGFFEQKWSGQVVVDDGWPSLESQRNCLGRFAGFLYSEVTREEIWMVVCSLGRNRAPGRDGVTASFFKFFWEIVG
ncbi:hypothetical protein MA16_Dca016244 [Dendrobium catenatum]|uniref:Uncharacterized protein n=1 Tax=Dendrobium catenatum TaxID=906689 RepID=A0A2I0VVT0_9ASPA|nr:hypothetical protein MA16_Dca016244 [Dendrobium catenatum]